MNSGITAHTIVRNEENFVWFALQSVIEYVDRLIIYDTGSTDKTVDLIKSIRSPKITFAQKGPVTREGLSRLRTEQIHHTRTPWILVVDGDEIYPTATIKEVTTLMRKADPNTWGVVVPFFNIVGDMNHVQAETAGRYHIGDRVGHINLRGLRNVPGLQVTGSYPQEAYEYQGKPMQNYPEHLKFSTHKYFHAGNLVRSSQDRITLERKFVFDLGLPREASLPEVFKRKPPLPVSPAPKYRSRYYVICATAKYIAKKLMGKQ